MTYCRRPNETKINITPGAFYTAQITFITLLLVIIIKVKVCKCKSRIEHYFMSPFLDYENSLAPFCSFVKTFSQKNSKKFEKILYSVDKILQKC